MGCSRCKKQYKRSEIEEFDDHEEICGEGTTKERREEVEEDGENDTNIEQNTKVCRPNEPLLVQEEECTEQYKESERDENEVCENRIEKEIEGGIIGKIIEEVEEDGEKDQEDQKHDTEQNTKVCRPNVPLLVQEEEGEVIEITMEDKCIDTLKTKEGTLEKRQKELEEVMQEWIQFNFTKHKSEEEYQRAKEKMRKIEEEKEITQKEWDKIWKMFARKKRKERKRQRKRQGKIANKIAIYKKRRISKANRRMIDYTWEKNPTEKRRGQVKAKGQENPLTRRKEEMLDEKIKSVVVFEPDYKIKKK